MKSLNILLLCDGSSDYFLTRPIEWIIGERFEHLSFRVIRAQTLVPARESLTNRLIRAAREYAPDLIVCHRDAEKVGFDTRFAEIQAAVAAADTGLPVIPVIPIRMTGSWLLFDEKSLRCAANNARGINQLNLPKVERLEHLPNPKQILFDCLREASGLAVQRSRRLDVHHARHRLGELIDDFSPLRGLASFRRFEESLITAIDTMP